MSTTLKTVIYKELDRLNVQIDKKILHGRPYHKEARRHKDLLDQLRQGVRVRAAKISRHHVDKHKYARYALSA